MAGKDRVFLQNEEEIKKRQEKIEQEELEIKSLVKSELIENKHIYEKLLDLEKLIKGEDSLQFKHVEEWKLYIWNDCEYKTTIEKENLIEHGCTKTNAPCHFVDCPKNIKQ